MAAKTITRFVASLIEVGAAVPALTPPRLSRCASERPAVTAFARMQANSGHALTNLLHEPVRVDGAARFVIPLLDGTHDRSGLVAAMEADTRWREPVSIAYNGAGIADRVEQILASLARDALLMA